jgi:hypothetical protein
MRTIKAVIQFGSSLLLLVLITIDSSSQVVIKERVIIGSGNTVKNNGKNTINSIALPPTSYVVNRSGTYLAWVLVAAKNGAPPEGDFTVAFRDSIRDTTIVFDLADYINYREPRNETAFDKCNGYTEVSYISYFSYSQDPYLPIRIPYILKGDTLNFSYDNCTQPAKAGAGMDVQFAKRDEYGDKCYIYFEGELQELELCGIDLTPMSFTVYQDDDTLNLGSSTVLYIYSNGNLGRYYPQIDDSLITIEVDSAQYAKFICDRGTRIDTLDSPMDSVRYYDAVAGNIKFLAMGKSPGKPVPVRICARMMSDPTRVFEDTIVVEGHDILLGETKYYYAVLENSTLKIKETTSPQLPTGAISDDVWGTNPTRAVLDQSKSGRRLGAYWEKEKPIPDGTGNLPRGMIRLVDRYWHVDSLYKVKLSASSGGESANIVVEVKKPVRLVAAGQNPDYINVKDVFADPGGPNNLNLDSLIIKFAGENGIPPQNIKGQMLKETTFRPAWRYEPFKDIEYQNKETGKRYFGTNMPFVVDATSMGTGDWPSLHTNVSPTPYINTPVTIGGFATEHWDRYVSHKSGNEPDKIIGSSALTKEWKKLYDEEKKKKQSDDKARVAAHTRLKNELLDADTDLGEQFSIVAQTRKVTSYGFIQMMYITAVDSRFFKETDGRYAPTGTRYVDQNDEHMFPEKLNEQDFFMPRYCDFLLKKLNIAILGNTPGRIPFYEWEDGFNARWKSAIKMYNLGEANYATDVLNNAMLFVPSNQ